MFKIKRDSQGHIERFKSRLVAKGCSQQYGVNFTETFSPVIRYVNIRMLLAEKELHLHQMDVSNAYLNSGNTESVYMKQPEHFVSKQYPNRVLKLNEALYGLKQSGRAWNSTLDYALKRLGFEATQNEPCLYKNISEDSYNLIAVYVDDLIIDCSKRSDLMHFKKKLQEITF